MKATLKFTSGVGGNRQTGSITLDGVLPASVLAAVFAAVDKLPGYYNVDMTNKAIEVGPLVEDIHPLDMAELLLAGTNPAVVDVIIYHEITEFNGKLYRQTIDVPRKKGDHKIV